MKLSSLLLLTAAVLTHGCAGSTQTPSKPATTATDSAMLAAQGASEWRQSCVNANADGTCVLYEELPAPNRCGDSFTRARVLKRDSALVESAREKLNRAAALSYGPMPKQAGARAKDGAVRATAQFYLAEALYEDFVAKHIADDAWLAGEQAEAAPEHLLAHVKRLTETGKSTTDAYAAIIDDDGAPGALRMRASRRLAQVAEQLAQTIRQAEIPASLRDSMPARVSDYCNELAVEARPLEELALDARAECRQIAAELGADPELSCR